MLHDIQPITLPQMMRFRPARILCVLALLLCLPNLSLSQKRPGFMGKNFYLSSSFSIGPDFRLKPNAIVSKAPTTSWISERGKSFVQPQIAIDIGGAIGSRIAFHSTFQTGNLNDFTIAYALQTGLIARVPGSNNAEFRSFSQQTKVESSFQSFEFGITGFPELAPYGYYCKLGLSISKQIAQFETTKQVHEQNQAGGVPQIEAVIFSKRKQVNYHPGVSFALGKHSPIGKSYFVNYGCKFSFTLNTRTSNEVADEWVFSSYTNTQLLQAYIGLGLWK